MYWKYLKSLFWHKWHVFRAGLVVGGIPPWRLIAHDWMEHPDADAAREHWIVSEQATPEQRGYVYVLAAIKKLTVGMDLGGMGANVDTAVFWGFDFEHEARLELFGRRYPGLAVEFREPPPSPSPEYEEE